MFSIFRKKGSKYRGKNDGRKKYRSGKKAYVGSYRKRSFLSKILNSFVAVLSISALILVTVLIISKISEVDFKAFKGKMSKLITSIERDKLPELKVSLDGLVGDNTSERKFDDDELLFRICILSDIHQDLENLSKALEKVTTLGCSNIFLIGDLTNYGDVDSLKKVRDILNTSGIEYYAIPGDHDIADSLSTENFNTVFGINYHIMEYKGVGFLMIDNSPNFTTISKTQFSWVEGNIDKVDFVITSQPLFVEGLNPPFSSTYMGSMISTPEGYDMKEKQKLVKEQGQVLLDLIRKNDNVKAIIAGEHHRSSELSDSVRSDLTHYVIGAVTSTVNDFPQTAIQSSRFTVLSIYEGKEYRVEDILID